MMAYASHNMPEKFYLRLTMICGLLSLICAFQIYAQEAKQTQTTKHELGFPWVSQDPRVNIYIGDKYLQNGEYDLALTHYRRALIYDGENTELLRRLVVALRDKLRIEIETGFGRSSAWGGNEEFEEALTLIYQAQAIDPSLEREKAWLLDEAQIQSVRAEKLQSKVLERVSVKVLEKAQTFHPDDPDILASLGKLQAIYSRSGEVQGLDLLKRAVAIEPANSLYHFYLGHALRKNGQHDSALREFHRAAQLATAQDDPAFREFYRVSQLPTIQEALSQRIHGKALAGIQCIFQGWSQVGVTGDNPCRQFGPKPGGVLTLESQIPLSERLEMINDLTSGHHSYGMPIDFGYDSLKLALYIKLGQLEKAADLFAQYTALQDTKSAYSQRYEPKKFGSEFDLLAKELPDAAMVVAVQLYRGKEERFGVGVFHEETHGLTIADTPKAGLAMSAGLQRSDRIRKVKDKSVPTLMDLANVLVELSPGNVVEFEVERSGKTVILTGQLPEQKKLPSGPRGWWGLKLDDEAVPRYGRVKEVVDGSPADKAGLKSGDRIQIQKVNDQELDTTQPIRSHIPLLRPQDKVELRVVRQGEELTVTIVLDEPPR